MMRMPAVVCAMLWLAGNALAADPPLKSGRDPGGVAVAVLAGGFDYRRTDIARVLARDGEGEAIAFDAVDGDHRPFGADASGDAVAEAVASRGGVRVVAVRVAERDAQSLAKGIAFAAATPARVVFVPMALDATGFEVLIAAVQRFPNVIFVVAKAPAAAEQKKQVESITTLILPEAGELPLATYADLGGALGCGVSGADLRAVLSSGPAATLAACEKGGKGAEQGRQPERAK